MTICAGMWKICTWDFEVMIRKLGQDTLWESLVSCPRVEAGLIFSLLFLLLLLLSNPTSPSVRQCPEGHTEEKQRAQAPSILLPLPLLLSLTLLLTGIESTATHVSDQVQPASSVSKLQAPGKPTESTFIAGDPVTECVIHYSLICTPLPPSPNPPNHFSNPALGQLHSLIKSIIKHTCGVTAVGLLIYQMQRLCLWPVCSSAERY